ncbi:MAG: cell wall hydrolase [Pseudomonadota bacterium]|nr:cell wall hydrolase [Pseudomonadota bacterium]MEC8664160.1 cell wall hydrolase [Pseudomonadota bacterium]
MKELKPVTSGAQPADAKLAAHKTEAVIDILARTLWGEARGEGTIGMQAVANVIINRAANPSWWGSNIMQVCRRPYQFSCWNDGDPNRSQLKSVMEKDLYFATALRIARRAAYGALGDITNGADHYHATGITPGWAKGQTPVAVIGNHIFYKLQN